MILGTVSKEPDERERNTRIGRRDAPIIGPRGLLTYGDRSVCLSALNVSLVDPLVHHFGTEVTDLELLDRGWSKGATRRQLRVRLRRLDRRVAVSASGSLTAATDHTRWFRSMTLHRVRCCAPQRTRSTGTSAR